MIPHIDERLWDWATYVDQRIHSGLGYGSRTIEYEMMRLGGVVISGTGQRPPDVNEKAEQIERAMLRMDDYLRELAVVRYLLNGKFPRDEDKAKRLGYSVATLKTYTNILHNRIEAYLDGLTDQREDSTARPSLL